MEQEHSCADGKASAEYSFPSDPVKPRQQQPTRCAAAISAHHERGSSCGTSTKSFHRILGLLPAFSCAFMLYSSYTAIRESHGDPGTIFFVSASLSILGILYLAMKEFEKAVANKNPVRRDRLKFSIWTLAVLLNGLFSYRVTSVLRAPLMTVIVWSVALITSLVGCYLLFLLPDKSQVNDASMVPAVQARLQAQNGTVSDSPLHLRSRFQIFDRPIDGY